MSKPTQLTLATFLAGSKFTPKDNNGMVFQFVPYQGLPVGNKGYIGMWGPIVNKLVHIADVKAIGKFGFSAGNMVLTEFLSKNFTFDEFVLDN